MRGYLSTTTGGWHMLIVHATDALATSLRGPRWSGEAERPLTLCLGCLSKDSVWATLESWGKLIFRCRSCPPRMPGQRVCVGQAGAAMRGCLSTTTDWAACNIGVPGVY